MSTATAAPARELPDHVRQHRIREWVGFGFRLTLGIVLLIAGGLKVGELDQSVRAVKAYRLMSPEVADFVGVALPPFEIVVGLFLVLGLFVRITAILSGLLMIVFIAGIASVWVRGISIECGCFNAGGDLDGPINAYEYAREIFRDVVLLGMAGWLTAFPLTALSLDKVLRPHLARQHLLFDDADELEHVPHPHHHHDEQDDQDSDHDDAADQQGARP